MEPAQDEDSQESVADRLRLNPRVRARDEEQVLHHLDEAQLVVVHTTRQRIAREIASLEARLMERGVEF